MPLWKGAVKCASNWKQGQYTSVPFNRSPAKPLQRHEENSQSPQRVQVATHIINHCNLCTCSSLSVRSPRSGVWSGVCVCVCVSVKERPRRRGASVKEGQNRHYPSLWLNYEGVRERGKCTVTTTNWGRLVNHQNYATQHPLSRPSRLH